MAGSIQSHRQDSRETIAAIITPPGRGGIAGLRIAGSDSRALLAHLVRHKDHSAIDWQPRYLHFGHLFDSHGKFIDEVTALWLPAPHTYTGLDQAEIFCHGSDLIARQILEVILAAGARTAEPGEFTRLAFENGRIDLTRAEAVAEMIGAQTDRATQVAREHLSGAYREHVESLRQSVLSLLAELEAGIDFTEQESYGAERPALIGQAQRVVLQLERLRSTYNEGRRLQTGFRVVIAGRPNAGKSSLFNILCKRQRAIVSPLPGTTRDYLTEWIELGGYPVELIDTAGLRSEGDEIERAGQSLARELLESADLILWIVDSSSPESVSEVTTDILPWLSKAGIVVANKSEIELSRGTLQSLWPSRAISCLTEIGLDDLLELIVATLRLPCAPEQEGLVVTSARQAEKLTRAIEFLKESVHSLENQTPPEEIVPSLRQAAQEFDEITGRVYTEEVLGAIFGKFCIGK